MSDNITITYHGGRMRQFELDGLIYSVSHLYCDCDDVTLVERGRRDGMLEITIDCPNHGKLNEIATHCQLFQAAAPDPVFAWAERRHEQDRRVAWGMAHHIKEGTS